MHACVIGQARVRGQGEGDVCVCVYMCGVRCLPPHSLPPFPTWVASLAHLEERVEVAPVDRRAQRVEVVFLWVWGVMRACQSWGYTPMLYEYTYDTHYIQAATPTTNVLQIYIPIYILTPPFHTLNSTVAHSPESSISLVSSAAFFFRSSAKYGPFSTL